MYFHILAKLSYGVKHPVPIAVAWAITEAIDSRKRWLGTSLLDDVLRWDLSVEKSLFASGERIPVGVLLTCIKHEPSGSPMATGRNFFNATKIEHVCFGGVEPHAAVLEVVKGLGIKYLVRLGALERRVKVEGVNANGVLPGAF